MNPNEHDTDTTDAEQDNAAEFDDLGDDEVFAPDPDNEDGDAPDLDTVPDADTGYAYDMPEGMELNTEMAEAFDEAFREVGLTQGQANQLVDAYATAHRDHFLGEVRQMLDGWVEAAKADREIGGQNWDDSIATAQKVIDRFGTPELMRDVISVQGLGAHPEMIRILTRIGHSLSDDVLEMTPPQPPAVDVWDYSRTTPAGKVS